MRRAWDGFVGAVNAGGRRIMTGPGSLGALLVVTACLAWRMGTGGSVADAQTAARGGLPRPRPSRP